MDLYFRRRALKWVLAVDYSSSPGCGVVRLTEYAVVNAIRFPMCGRGIYLPEGRLNEENNLVFRFV